MHHLAQQAACNPHEIIDFSANINPVAPPEWLQAELHHALNQTNQYPDPFAENLITTLAEQWEVSNHQLVAGNGSSELIYALARMKGATRVVTLSPTYSGYQESAVAAEKPFIKIPLLEPDLAFPEQTIRECLQNGDLVFLGHPNNPTGGLLDRNTLSSIVRDHPESLFVLDESFIEFSGEHHSFRNQPLDNLVVLRSMTKFEAIPGIRLGIALGNSALLESLRKALPPWRINQIAICIGSRFVKDHTWKSLCFERNKKLRNDLFNSLSRFSEFKPYSSQANFILVEVVKQNINITHMHDTLLKKHRLAIRIYPDEFNNRFFRVAVKEENDNRKLIEALEDIFSSGRIKKTNRKTPAIMFQGTGSNVGKSLLVAALCRSLRQNGINVAPFKAQNMSNNSFVTRNGHEVARAQTLQAMACGIAPDVHMSPVLLKPSSDRCSQVIIHGLPVDHMNVHEYHDFKEKAFNAAKESYEELSSRHDVIILEGAGSCAEINLKNYDFVNMPMAKYANSKVILVGNIDPGGVYAALIGSMLVSAPWERDLVCGFIINKFRGDPTLLTKAHKLTSTYTGKPVLGVMPWMENLKLPEEDSFNLRNEKPLTTLNKNSILIGLIQLPTISNFTDFDPLQHEDDVELHKVTSPSDWESFDIIIIPGSKNTLSDLNWLFNTGLNKKIVQHVENGNVCIGICGGLQILGKHIHDNYAIESKFKQSPGLGLLDIETQFESSKTLSQIHAEHKPTGIKVSGYEIHHGKTQNNSALPIFLAQGKEVGYGNTAGNVWATYLHGIFDNDQFRNHCLKPHRKAKCLPESFLDHEELINQELDRLATQFTEHVDMEFIHQTLGL